VGSRAGLDDLEKRKFFTLLRLELRPLGPPAGSQSLYRLRYPGSTGKLDRAFILSAFFFTQFVSVLCKRLASLYKLEEIRTN
jgi:hypothetical protein